MSDGVPSRPRQVSDRADLRLKLSAQLGLVQDAVRLLLTMYCQAFRTDFSVVQTSTDIGRCLRTGGGGRGGGSRACQGWERPTDRAALVTVCGSGGGGGGGRNGSYRF